MWLPFSSLIAACGSRDLAQVPSNTWDPWEAAANTSAGVWSNAGEEEEGAVFKYERMEITFRFQVEMGLCECVKGVY